MPEGEWYEDITGPTHHLIVLYFLTNSPLFIQAIVLAKQLAKYRSSCLNEHPVLGGVYVEAELSFGKGFLNQMGA